MVLKNNLNSVIDHLISKGYNIDCVFDIGANKGLWTAQYSGRLPKAQFCLFEANPKHTRPGKLAPQHKWFSNVLSKPGVTEVEFYIANNKYSGTGDSYYREQTLAYDGCKPTLLPANTLDTIVSDNALRFPQLVKLDTQGSELDILRGASNVMKHADIFVTEMAVMPYNVGAPSFDDYIQFFTSRGCVPMGINEIQFADNILVQVDVVFLKKEVKAKYYGDKGFFSSMNTLVELFDKYGCDKGNLKHRYDRVYEHVLDQMKDHPFRMLEIGIFKGNSTEAFIEYCPQVDVVGVDIFTRVDVKNIPILNHPRVHPCKCDSLKGPTTEFKELAEEGFDIIIDDGLHTHEAQWKTFLNFIPHLKEDGVYFIEDVWAYDKMTPVQKQHPWLHKHAPAFSEKEYQKLLDVLESYNVTYHDMREGHDPDTFILEVRK